MDLHDSSAQNTGNSRLLPLTLTAIGVVYGDIGTSPLYTIRECFFGAHAVALNHDNVLGVLSLILYALLIVVSVKYIAIVMRADNQGEGGILALATLMPEKRGRSQVAGRLAEGRPVLVLLAIFGAALLYGDGMITPAITVLGAMEGLTVATPLFNPVRDAAVAGDHRRHLPDPALRHGQGGAAVRARHGGVVRHHRRAGRGGHRARAGGDRGAEPGLRIPLLPRQRLAGVRGAGRRGAGGDRRRGAVRRHGPLRQAPDPPGVVRAWCCPR